MGFNSILGYCWKLYFSALSTSPPGCFELFLLLATWEVEKTAPLALCKIGGK